MVLLNESCTGKRNYQKGNYDVALNNSINKLRKNPSNAKAAEAFESSYNMSVKTKMEEVYRLEKSNDVYKWEKIINLYQSLNATYDQINRCPGCLKVISDPNSYTTVLENAKVNAAGVRYNMGIEQMKLNSIASAQSAYRHFTIAKSYVSNYKDIDKQLQLALDAGTLKVVMEHIPMHSRLLKLSNEFFENNIQEFLSGLNYEFVRFYTPQQARSYNISPNQYIQCQFDDFVVGQSSIYEKEQEIRKDSFIVKTSKVGGKDVNEYSTVKATLHTFTKTLTSSGLLDLRIVDTYSGSTLSQSKLPGTYVWETRWGNFNGDERALSAEQKKIIGLREAYPPAPQDLFIEFTKPIFGQVNNALRNYYNNYRL